MEIVVHRVNTIEKLKEVDSKYGVELDVRADGSSLILNHEPFCGGESFVDYLDEYNHGLMVLNIKEAGIENEVLRLVREKGIKRHFLLDVEFPYIYQATRKGEHAIAMRYSEDEAIETVLNYTGKADWVWIDTNTQLPLNMEIIEKLKPFKTCLVCPERWGRPQDIGNYIDKMIKLDFRLDAVMTSLKYSAVWEQYNVLRGTAVVVNRNKLKIPSALNL